MTDNANCEFGEKQTSSHLLECTLLPSGCEIKDLIWLIEIVNEMIGIVEYWENQGL